MVMTRVPNVTTVLEDASVSQAADLLVKREVDSLPVVRLDPDFPDKMSFSVLLLSQGNIQNPVLSWKEEQIPVGIRCV